MERGAATHENHRDVEAAPLALESHLMTLWWASLCCSPLSVAGHTSWPAGLSPLPASVEGTCATLAEILLLKISSASFSSPVKEHFSYVVTAFCPGPTNRNRSWTHDALSCDASGHIGLRT